MPDFELVAVSKPNRFPDEITAVLLKRIDAGIYQPGSKLPSTRELADLFHVSPPIVREALSRLKYDGYIEPRQGSGVYVKDRLSSPSLRLDVGMDVDHTLLADTYEVRLHVEQSCAELAALRRSSLDLISMRGELEQMALAVRNRTDGTAADVRFHLAIASATHNIAMLKLVKFLHGSLADSVKMARANSDRVPGHPEKAQQEHEALFKAIEVGDPKAARQAVRTHLEGAPKRLGLRIGPAKEKAPIPKTSRDI